jgi:D-serine deaminase-like pyridoxal phosphate-dependent protein
MAPRLLLEELDHARLSERDKGIPARAFGRTVAEFIASEPRLSEFWTPLVALDNEAIDNNLAVMAEWSNRRHFELMPHGKTTMAPALWQRQLDAGCRGISLATMGQVRAARHFGLASIMLANAVVDPRSLRYLAAELEDPALRFACWADSIATVKVMEQTLREAGIPRPVDVCVEIGAAGGRTGARTIDEAVDIARYVAASDVVRLAGIAGYEGCLAHERSAESAKVVRAFLDKQLAAHRAIGELYDDHGDVFVTAGGSAWFDIVGEAFAEAAATDTRAAYTLRSGGYAIHDDGFYHHISPLDRGGRAPEPRLRAAMHGIARVVSAPEPGLVLLDGGKRDFAFDEGLPSAQQASADLGQSWTPLTDTEVTAMNDQHTYLRLKNRELPVGSVVKLGLSHPCTVFDKWQYLPLVASRDSDRVVGLVRTWF